MRKIEFAATLNIYDEAGVSTGTRQAQIVGRVFPRKPTEANPCPWQLHDYRAYLDGQEMTEISGDDGDAIKSQAETFATNTPEEPETPPVPETPAPTEPPAEPEQPADPEQPETPAPEEP